MTKQEKIEKLIQMEWEDFQKVNNEGGRASCQDDPETFFIMRRSHFAPWTEELIDCVQSDMDRAHEQGRQSGNGEICVDDGEHRTGAV